MTGYFNTAIGLSAMYWNVSGYYNTAVGTGALYTNTSGTANTAFGNASLQNTNTGTDNTAVGDAALYTNNTGSFNTATGKWSSNQNTTGSHNTANGDFSLFITTTGDYNTGIGSSAMNSNTTGSWNTCIGEYSNVSTTNLDGATAIGASAVVNATNKIVIGASIAGMVIGGYAPWSNLSDGRFKTNVEDDVPGLSFITKLKPVTYAIDYRKLDLFLTQHMADSTASHYIKDNATYEENSQLRHTGFIAQDVEKLADDLGWNFDGVNAPKNDGDNYSLAYSQFVMPLVKAVQEQQKQIETLQKQNDDLKARLDKLENIVAHK